MSIPQKSTNEWESSLSIGKRAEELFIPAFEKEFGLHLKHLCNEPGKERGADFQIVETGALLEMKFDSYTDSDNYVLEWYSDKDRKTWGGMVQASLKGCQFYCIFMPNDSRRQIHLFSCQSLIGRYITTMHLGRHHSGKTTRNGNSWFNECRVIQKQLFNDLLIGTKSQLLTFSEQYKS